MAKMTVEAKLNQGTGMRPMRSRRKAKEPKKKRLVVDIPPHRVYEKALVYPPIDEASQNKLADQLFQWSLTAPAYRIEEFALSLKMNPYKFKKLREKNEYFAEIYQCVESAFACKYSKGALTKEFDAGTAHRHLWMVDPEYYDRTTQLDREKLDLAKQNATESAGSGTTTFVVMPTLDTHEKTTEKPTE